MCIAGYSIKFGIKVKHLVKTNSKVTTYGGSMIIHVGRCHLLIASHNPVKVMHQHGKAAMYSNDFSL